MKPEQKKITKSKKITKKQNIKTIKKKAAQKKELTSKKIKTGANMAKSVPIEATGLGTLKMPTGKCVMIYMGNSYCEDGITKKDCEAKADTYPGAICTWTKGATCKQGILNVSSLEEK